MSAHAGLATFAAIALWLLGTVTFLTVPARAQCTGTMHITQTFCDFTAGAMTKRPVSKI